MTNSAEKEKQRKRKCWCIALAIIDAMMGGAGLVFRTTQIPPRFVAYPFYQIAVSIGLLIVSIGGIAAALNGKKWLMKAWIAFFAGTALCNVFALSILATTLVYRRLWYRMCENPKECPLQIDYLACEMATFVVVSILWTVGGQLPLGILTAHRWSETEATTGNGAEVAASSSNSHLLPLKTPLPAIGGVVAGPEVAIVKDSPNPILLDQVATTIELPV